MKHWKVTAVLQHFCNCQFCKLEDYKHLDQVVNGDDEAVVEANIEKANPGYKVIRCRLEEMSEAEYAGHIGSPRLPYGDCHDPLG